jgi:hypothetical protein
LCRDAIPPVQARIEQLEDWSRQRDREIAEVEACRAILLASPPAPQTETISYTSPLCASDLARLLREKGYLRASDDAVDSWLRRYRTDFPDCYEERNQDDRRRNEPRILYRPEVWPELVRHFAPVTDDT